MRGSYQFKVKAKCDGSISSPYSAWSFFVTGNGSGGGTGGGGGGTGGACDTPTGLTVSDITANSAVITWNAVTGAQGYELQVEDDENTPAFNWEVIVTGTQATVTGLSPNGNYQVKVKTKCDGGNNSVDSDWVFFSTTTTTSTFSPAQLAPNQGNSFSAYLSPNPAYGGESIYLKMENTAAAETVWVMVYDLQGRVYKTIEAQGFDLEAISIPTSGLQPGMYQVVIRNGNDVQSRRFSLLD
ncbi:MAG: T9SS type A sorting domain-containing protein [Saprospirales bacterium]|nr:T9SS type A sorting domain-containing protein [Saprospirales bacterium]